MGVGVGDEVLLYLQLVKERGMVVFLLFLHCHCRPRGYKTFFMLNSAEHEICMLINLKLLTIANSFLLNIAEHENFSANDMKMPTIVGIFLFITRGKFMLS